MKTLLTGAALVALAFVVGCDRRDSSTTTPDRGQHAAGAGGTRDAAVPGPGENYYTLQQGDTLTSVAKARGTTVDQLIHRNHITGDVKPGTRLVVPETTPAAAKPATAPAKP